MVASPAKQAGWDYFILLFESKVYCGIAMQMIIANTLSDGFVVFLTAEHGWTSDIAAGAVAESEADAQALLAAAQAAEARNEVIDPYLIEISIESGQRAPVEYREFIRATGPSFPLPA